MLTANIPELLNPAASQDTSPRQGAADVRGRLFGILFMFVERASRSSAGNDSAVVIVIVDIAQS